MNDFETLHRTTRRVSLTVIALVIGTLLLAAWNIVERQDRAAETAAHRQYCSEVSIWRAEAARGIPAIERTGHPDYRAIADSQCQGIRPAVGQRLITSNP